MKNLIIGYGNVGRLLTAELQSTGDAITVAHHGAPADQPTVDHIQIDLLDAGSVSKAVAGHDRVFVTTGLPYKLSVWRAQWPVIIDNVVAACEQAKAKLIFIDNIYLYGPSPLLSPMKEDHPRQPPSQKGAVRLEMVNKLEAAMKRGLEVLILRCADFYGPSVNSSGLCMAIDAALAGKKAYFFGNPDTRHAYSYVPDIAKAAVKLAQADDTYGQTWHTPTAPAVTGREMMQLIETAIGKPVQWSIMRPSQLRWLGLFVPVLRELREMMYQFENDYDFDSSKFMTRFSELRTTQYKDGIAASVAAAKL